MKIAVVQFKSIVGEIDKNVETARRMIDGMKNVDVIILPELWTTGYYPMPVENFADKNGECTAEIICELSKKNGVNIIGGSAIVNDGGKIFNRCLMNSRKRSATKFCTRSGTAICRRSASMNRCGALSE